MCIGGVGGGGRAIVIAQRDEESPLTLECYRGKQSSFGKHSSFWRRRGGGERREAVPPRGTPNSSDRGDTGILKATFSSSRLRI